MSKRLSQLAGASLFFAVSSALPAHATSLVTFVSGKGTDTGTCASPASPCRSFQFAINQASAGGEVKALEPAEYGAVTITKSISISGVEGASIDRVSGDAIIINAQLDDAVSLSHLIIDGAKTANNGIVISSGGSLNVTNCTVRNFAADGIRIVPAPVSPQVQVTNFLIADTVVSDNKFEGIIVFPQGGVGTTQARGTIERVTMNRNGGDGLLVTSPFVPGAASATVVDSVAAGNRIGFNLRDTGLLRLARSATIDNDADLVLNSGGRVLSAGDNLIEAVIGDGFPAGLIKLGTR